MPQPAYNTKVVVALTGGIGCGKSTAGRFLQELGWAVIDADDLAREALTKEGAAFQAVLTQFGERYLLPSGDLDRRALGRHVFDHPSALAALNTIVHPFVRASWQTWMGEREASGERGVVIVPLLFEVAADKEFETVICITANQEETKKRLGARGWSDQEITQRLQAQWPVKKKAAASDYVIENSGSLEELKMQLHKVTEQILNEKGKEHARRT